MCECAKLGTCICGNTGDLQLFFEHTEVNCQKINCLTCQEKFRYEQIKCKNCIEKDGIIKRLNKIISDYAKEEIKEFHALQGKQSTKNPHKCPVCEGSRYINQRLNSMVNGVDKDKCVACEGKGIVWG